MNLLCALVTHNRVEYSVGAVESWLATSRACDRLVVFDNASTDGTVERLREIEDPRLTVIVCSRNLFPGAATNRAWYHGIKTSGHLYDLLQRSDNDVEYLDGWRDEVERAFTEIPELGLFGVLNRHEDYDGQQPVKEDRGVNVHWDQVGGNCVIRRSIWDDGFRWIPGRWMPGGHDEDSIAAAEIRQKWLVGTAIPTVARNMSFHRFEDYPDYYRQTAGLRGLVPELSV